MKLLDRLPIPTDRTNHVPPREPETAGIPIPTVCPRCSAQLPRLGEGEPAALGVCRSCGAHARLGARARLLTLVDEAGFHEFGQELRAGDPLEFFDGLSYPERLAEAHERTGEPEALLTGTATIGGNAVVVAILDFGFLGGSMGTVVGEKLSRAAELAIKLRVPLVSVVGSGGARMQEGVLSLLQMAKTAAAINRLRADGLPYISILTDPTTGGVFASFASLGDLVVAEPGALIGFAGPRVVEQTTGRALPPGSHTAEFLFEHGIIDAVVPRVDLRGYVSTAIATLAPAGSRSKVDRPEPAARPTSSIDAWHEVQLAREPDRPTSLDYVHRLSPSFVELHGDRAGFDDPAVIAGFARLGDQPVVIVGFERGHAKENERRHGGRPYAEGFRKAKRAMGLAARLHLPLVTLIDTPGPYPGIESEERGLAGQIATTLALMSELPVPTIAAIVGEGGSGAAVALGAADRVLMQEHAIYSVIGPEGAAAILYRDAERAASVAPRLKLTAFDLLDLGVVDVVVAEPEGGAAADPDLAAALLGVQLQFALHELHGRSRERLLKARRDRYRRIGLAHVHGDRRLGAAGRVLDLVRRVRPRRSDGTSPTVDESPTQAAADGDAAAGDRHVGGVPVSA